MARRRKIPRPSTWKMVQWFARRAQQQAGTNKGGGNGNTVNFPLFYMLFNPVSLSQYPTNSEQTPETATVEVHESKQYYLLN